SVQTTEAADRAMPERVEAMPSERGSEIAASTGPEHSAPHNTVLRTRFARSTARTTARLQASGSQDGEMRRREPSSLPRARLQSGRGDTRTRWRLPGIASTFQAH